MKNREKNQNAPNEQFERQLYKAVRSMGWLLPDSEKALEEQERELQDDRLELPERLRDPFAALDPSRRSRWRATERVRRSDEIDESLARAAREGNDSGAIHSDIEERMSRDRSRAETKNDD